MPQVVEGQALDTSRLTDLLEGLGDRIGAHISGRMAYAPYPAIDTPGQDVQDVQDAQGGRGERHPARRPGLHFRDQEPRALRSRWSQRMAAISPRRMAVSIAQVMISAIPTPA